MKKCTKNCWHTFLPVNCLLKIKTLRNVTHVCHWNDTTGTRFMQSMSLDHSPGCFVPGYFRATLREDVLHSFGRSAAGPGGSTRRGTLPMGHRSTVNHRMLTSQGNCGLFNFSGSWSVVPKKHYAAARGLRGGCEDLNLDFVQWNRKMLMLFSRKPPRVIICEFTAEGGGYNILPQVISLRERWWSIAFIGVVRKNRNSSFIFIFHLLFVSSNIKVDFFYSTNRMSALHVYVSKCPLHLKRKWHLVFLLFSFLQKVERRYVTEAQTFQSALWWRHWLFHMCTQFSK